MLFEYDLSEGLGIDVEKLSTAEDNNFATYIIKQGGVQVGEKINVPKDFVVKSGSVKTAPASPGTALTNAGVGANEKYISLIINSADNNSGGSELIIPAKDLIESVVTFSQTQASGANTYEIGKITINGVTTTIYGKDTNTTPAHAVNDSTYGLGTSNVYGHTKVIENLTTDAGNGLALGAGQGKALKEMIDDLKDGTYDLTDVISDATPNIKGIIKKGDIPITLVQSSDATAYTASVTDLTQYYHGLTLHILNWKNATNNANATLNVNSLGAKPIFYKGRAIKAGEFPYSMVSTFVYSGSDWTAFNNGNGAWHLIGDFVEDGSITSAKIADKAVTNAKLNGTNIINGTNLVDINTFTKTGFYYCDNDANAPYMINAPLSMEATSAVSGHKSFFLLVEDWGTNSYSCKQTLTYFHNNNTYTRTKTNSTTWTAWKLLGQHGENSHNHSDTQINWNGSALAGSVSPVDMAMYEEFNANRLAYLPGDNITVEYSTDNGSTWINYNATAIEKLKLVTTSQTFTSGKGSTTNYSKNRLRITIDAGAITSTVGAKLYMSTRKLMIYFCECNATGTKVLVEKALYTENTTFSTIGTYDVKGWTGWNSIPLAITFGGYVNQGNGQQVQKIRLTFTCTGGTGNFSVQKIRLFGETAWTKPSNLADTGHIYTYNENQDATFPAKIIKSGGTSSQFLKADGSVDSTTYVATGDSRLSNARTPTAHTDNNGAYGKATTSVWGHTKLNSATDSTDETTAATPKAVKEAYDKGNHSHPYISTTAGSVGASNLASNAVETAKIKDGNVTYSKLGSDIEINGTNILIGTQSFSGNTIPTGTTTPETYRNCTARYIKNTTSSYIDFAWSIPYKELESNGYYTLSFWAKTTTAHNKLTTYFYSGNVNTRRIKSNSNDSSATGTSGYGDGSTYISPTTSWKRYYVVYQLNSTAPGTSNKTLTIRIQSDTTNKPDIYLAGVKFEKGNIPTGWSPSPSDKASSAHTHGSLANGGTLNSDITSVNKVAVTDSSNNLKTISNLPVSKVSGLSTVATSGSYADLSNKPSYTATITSSTTGAYKIGSINISGSNVDIYGKDTNTTYSAATGTSAVGLVKISDNYTSSAGSASQSVAASSKAVYDAYTTLDNGKASNGHNHDGTYLKSYTPPTASTSQAGIVQLNSAINSTSTTQAATPSAVKAAYDVAHGKPSLGTTSTTAAKGDHTHDYSNTYASKTHTHETWTLKKETTYSKLYANEAIKLAYLTFARDINVGASNIGNFINLQAGAAITGYLPHKSLYTTCALAGVIIGLESGGDLKVKVSQATAGSCSGYLLYPYF